MIKLFEEYSSGVFKVELPDKILYLYLNVDYVDGETIVDMVDDDGDLYQHLSIKLPDSDKLENEEFFLNPEVNKNIVDVLIEQGFIEKTEKESIAGNKKTYSYILV
jgi:hypothetical protein